MAAYRVTIGTAKVAGKMTGCNRCYSKQPLKRREIDWLCVV